MKRFTLILFLWILTVGMLSFGGSAALGYGFRNGFTLDIRVGAGYPLFF